ncbi:hypothetical protein [Microvirga tunisiensis]|uniref:Uncharacterized protein n=1 Tax=Microvirga tunisiensis TaxID=2108360 RepID=A0A5N7MMX4_9HYPH|nr:hypothetical protein [Microvirga tunisiensis]MPR10062.1 hypothetical protein [Microvirga tunisiensis]MPR28253.1 hypothetical protein [Microvirga tunisiensis]
MYIPTVSMLPSIAASTVQSPELAPAIAQLGREAPLSYAFDAVLGVAPSVRSVSDDLQCEKFARTLGLAQVGLVLRSVRLTSGRSVSLVAVPSACWRDPVLRARILDLKWAVEFSGRRLVLVPESVIRAEPRLTNALLISACDGVRVTPRERLILLSHLAEVGGSASLEVCAEALTGSADPAGAVLRLVAERVLTIALDRPIDLQSEVSLAAWR